MPYQTPTLPWEQIRNHTEKWSWIDPKSGIRTTGFNPPSSAKKKRQVPYFIRYLTSDGLTEYGEVVTLKVFPEQHQRMVKFIHSNEIRRIRDYLIIEVDGVRFRVG